MSALIGPGVLVLVVGPSGAGKDTLMGRARQALGDDFRFPKRVVTRPASDWEDHESLDDEAFAQVEASGGFALSWQAHGLSYGITRLIADDIRAGFTVVCNVSRSSIGQARQRFECVRVIYVDARPEVLAARIAARGRDQSVESRRDQARTVPRPTGCDAVIDNSGDLEPAAAAFIAALRRLAVEGDHPRSDLA